MTNNFEHCIASVLDKNNSAFNLDTLFKRNRIDYNKIYPAKVAYENTLNKISELQSLQISPSDIVSQISSSISDSNMIWPEKVASIQALDDYSELTLI
jgi:outer membrane cobalamin receptor